MALGLVLAEVNWQVLTLPVGAKMLVFTDPQSGISVQIPLDAGAVLKLRAALSSLEVPVNGTEPG